LAGIGKCSAPCEDEVTPGYYGQLVGRLLEAWRADVSTLIAPLRDRLTGLSAAQRYEEAALLRDRIATLVRSCARTQSLSAITAIDELVAAKPDSSGGWELAVIRRGRLVGAEVAPRGVPPLPIVDSMVSTAEAVTDDAGPALVAVVEETELLLRWLGEPGVRLVRSTHSWALPAAGAARQRSWLASTSSHGSPTDPFADRRRLAMTARPARPGL
jgi:DNA polymerase-3 subunit epsilon